jgi:CheY-like chemotaxis protein
MGKGSDLMTQVNVLIVDDRPENLLALESTLSGLGSHLEFVRSAEHALRYLLTNEVALILLDVQMPGVNGFELAELIRQREHTQHTPIIFILATSVDQDYVFKGYSLGAVDYLTKPYEPEILKSKVAFFTKLHEQHREIKQQATLLEEANAGSRHFERRS